MVTRVRADMPVDKTPRGRGWAVAVFGMIILALGFGVAEIFDASHPSGYRGYHMNPADWVYPIDEVRTWLTAIAGECLIACLVLAMRTKVSVGARALFLGGLFFCGVMALAVIAMHADSPIIDHIVFMFFASVFLTLFAIGSLVAHLIQRSRDARNARSASFVASDSARS
jgi:hypothetical protein